MSAYAAISTRNLTFHFSHFSTLGQWANQTGPGKKWRKGIRIGKRGMLSFQKSYHATLLYKVKLASPSPSEIHSYTQVPTSRHDKPGDRPRKPITGQKHHLPRPHLWLTPMDHMGITVKTAPEPGIGVSESTEVPQAQSFPPSPQVGTTCCSMCWKNRGQLREQHVV